MSTQTTFDLYCGSNHKICDSSWLCFYKESLNPKSPTHLIIVPERVEEFKREAKIIDNPDVKKRNISPCKVLCKSCGKSIGNICNLVPNSAPLLCIGRDHTWLSCEQQTKQQWKELSAILHLETRNDHSVNSSFNALVETERNFSQLNIASIEKLTKTKPWSYQIEMFVEAIQHNVLVCMPTGSGMFY